MQPIVVIVADIREFDDETWHCVPDQYLTAVCKVAKVLPLFLPALGANIDFDELLDRVDGVLLLAPRVMPWAFSGIPNTGLKQTQHHAACSSHLAKLCINMRKTKPNLKIRKIIHA